MIQHYESIKAFPVGCFQEAELTVMDTAVLKLRA
jgi:hypothetical protein